MCPQLLREARPYVAQRPPCRKPSCLQGPVSAVVRRLSHQAGFFSVPESCSARSTTSTGGMSKQKPCVLYLWSLPPDGLPSRLEVLGMVIAVATAQSLNDLYKHCLGLGVVEPGRRWT